jgi:hypothetical protein
MELKKQQSAHWKKNRKRQTKRTKWRTNGQGLSSNRPQTLDPQARGPLSDASTLKRLQIRDSKAQKQPLKQEEANGCKPSASEARKSSSALETRTSVVSFIAPAADGAFPAFRAAAPFPFRPIRSSSCPYSLQRGWRGGWAASFGAARAVWLERRCSAPAAVALLTVRCSGAPRENLERVEATSGGGAESLDGRAHQTGGPAHGRSVMRVAGVEPCGSGPRARLRVPGFQVCKAQLPKQPWAMGRI